MGVENIIIRNEMPDDYEAILRLTYEAFLTLDYPGRRRTDEHYLIHLLQNCPHVIPELCYVAEAEGKIVGHILYTRSAVVRLDKTELETVTFGPLSVLPKCQRQGIGRMLVRHSMEKAREMGFAAVLIDGVPDYYPRLGFVRAREYGLTLRDGSSDDSFMAYELKAGALHGGGTLYFLAETEFERAERDDDGFWAFHQAFMRAYYPGQAGGPPAYGQRFDA
jgi:predicted N-acetyltransferase YhbS